MIRGKKIGRRFVSAAIALVLALTMTLADCAEKVSADDGLAEVQNEVVQNEVVENEGALVSEEQGSEEDAAAPAEEQGTEEDAAAPAEEQDTEENGEPVVGEEAPVETTEGSGEPEEVATEDADETEQSDEITEGIVEETEQSDEITEDSEDGFEEEIESGFVGAVLAAAPTEEVLSSRDSDHDGINDYEDKRPYDNVFTGKMIGYYDIAEAKYTMDLSLLFGDLRQYNDKLSSASLQMANIMYSGAGFEYDAGLISENETKRVDIVSFLGIHGFEDSFDKRLDEINTVDGIDDQKYTDAYDDDISEFGIGHQDVTIDGETKHIVVIAIRGTNGSVAEWSSNFDIGNPKTEKWDDKECHKGFYNTEERIREYVNAYVDKYVPNDGTDTLFWITGHSRGASLGNLLAAKMIDVDNRHVVAYTYAAAAVTISNAREDAKYSTIFNIVNANDIVPRVPLKSWGFGLYGQTTKLDIDELGRSEEWSRQTGNGKYNAIDEEVINLVEKRIVKSIAKDWNEIFDYAGVQLISNKQYGYLSERAKDFCELKTRKFLGIKTGYKLYPTFAFVFQLGAELIAGDDTQKDNAKEIFKELWNSKYTGALVLLIGDGIGNLSTLMNHWPADFADTLVGDGHAPATYYILIRED